MKCILCGKTSQNYLCEDCKNGDLDEIRRYEKYYNLQIVLMILPLILIIPMICFNEKILLITSIFCLIEGSVLFIFPYSIPDTVKQIGLIKDIKINKKISLLFLFLGILFLLLYLVQHL